MRSDQLRPQVGIFWLVGNRLIIESTPVSAAEPYGDCLNHPKSHIDYWAEHQTLGDLPRDAEYESVRSFYGETPQPTLRSVWSSSRKGSLT